MCQLPEKSVYIFNWYVLDLTGIVRGGIERHNLSMQPSPERRASSGNSQEKNFDDAYATVQKKMLL